MYKRILTTYEMLDGIYRTMSMQSPVNQHACIPLTESSAHARSRNMDRWFSDHVVQCPISRADTDMHSFITVSGILTPKTCSPDRVSDT